MKIKELKRLFSISVLSIFSLTIWALNPVETGAAEKKTPNFIIIFADDMGYGDVGVFGHPTMKTPNLDKMATEGQKWTQFYVAASVCTPSRAGLMTGRLPIRSGMCSAKKRVLFENATGGLPTSEITIASALKKGGYKTACIGKWHLGDDPEFLPTSHGFDYYYGIPYSNDMQKTYEIKSLEDYIKGCREPEIEYFNVPLMRNTEIIEQPAQQTTLTKRYTEEAVKFIKENKNDQFFLYLAHSMPHVPLFASDEFKGKSLRGIYGDVMEELDWSVGEVLKTLKETGLDENTIVVFTSDNGPWTLMETDGGSAGCLRGGKGGTYEGGMREPTIFWSPELFPVGVVDELGTTMDLLPTFCRLAHVELPKDRLYDGYDISPVLFHNGKDPRKEVVYYRGTQVYAVRKGAYKAHFIIQEEYGGGPEVLKTPVLYNLNMDPSEKYDIAKDHPDIIQELIKLRDDVVASVKPVVNQLEKPYKK
jgi:arylsulfatase A